MNIYLISCIINTILVAFYKKELESNTVWKSYPIKAQVVGFLIVIFVPLIFPFAVFLDLLAAIKNMINDISEKRAPEENYN